jgi:hypothetical protein
LKYLRLSRRSRLQKVETRKLQLAGTGERLIISNGYNCHNARFAVRLSPHGEIYFLQATPEEETMLKGGIRW